MTLSFTFQCHSRSNMMVLLDSVYIVFCCCFSNIWPHWAPNEIKCVRTSVTLNLPFRTHSKSNVMALLDSPYKIFYSCIIVTTYPSPFSCYSRSKKFSIKAKLWTPHPPLPRGDFYQNRIILSFYQREGLQKWSELFIFYIYFVKRQTYRQNTQEHRINSWRGLIN